MHLVADILCWPGSDTCKRLVLALACSRGRFGNRITARRFSVAKCAPVRKYTEAVTRGGGLAQADGGEAGEGDEGYSGLKHEGGSKLGGDGGQAKRLL